MRKSIVGILFAVITFFLFFTCAEEKSEDYELTGQTVFVGEVPDSAFFSTVWEGTYDCITSGKVYLSGTTMKIAFWGKSTCPMNTTLGDGSKWNYRPSTCKAL